MQRDQQREDHLQVPQIQLGSSPDSCRESSSSSEKAIEGGGESSSDSPKPFSPFTSGPDSPDEGAVGGGGLQDVPPPPEVAETQEDRMEQARQLQIQATTLDKRGLHSGKLDVFRKYFDHDDLEFCTRPEGRQRHKAQRHRHCSEGAIPPDCGSLENPLAALQAENPEAEAVLNQAGAIVGVQAPTSEFDNLRGNPYGQFLPVFGIVGDPLHSVTSATTIPVVEAYVGNYSPVEEVTASEKSDRGMSSGSSFPSFPSRAAASPDSYNLRISPLPGYLLRSSAARSRSPLSTTDSDSLPPERPVRRRRVGPASKSISAPARSRSAHAAVYPDKSSGAIPKRRAYDSPVDSSSERVSSEDDSYSVTYPELLLSQSADSDTYVPMPDIEVAEENLKQGMDALMTVTEKKMASMAINMEVLERKERDRISALGVGQDTFKEVVPSTGESEQDPMSSQSSTPDTAKRTGEDEPMCSQTSSPDNVEEVKPTIPEDEPMSSQSYISGYRRDGDEYEPMSSRSPHTVEVKPSGPEQEPMSSQRSSSPDTTKEVKRPPSEDAS